MRVRDHRRREWYRRVRELRPLRRIRAMKREWKEGGGGLRVGDFGAHGSMEEVSCAGM